MKLWMGGEWIDGWGGWMEEWMDPWIDELMGGVVNVLMNVMADGVVDGWTVGSDDWMDVLRNGWIHGFVN